MLKNLTSRWRRPHLKPALPFGSVHDEAAEERRLMLLELKAPGVHCRVWPDIDVGH
jgi:hypothetical protein